MLRIQAARDAAARADAGGWRVQEPVFEVDPEIAAQQAARKQQEAAQQEVSHPLPRVFKLSIPPGA